MTLIGLDKAPFPWNGGKSRAADAVWSALGDVPHYVEPFCGSMAVLLRRPHEANRPYHSETVSDADGLLVNAWRGIQLQPDATADAASWPVSEADLHARHLALVRWREEHQLEHLMGDPAWCDPVMAGWWLWGCSCWIGSGWCSGDGPWVRGDDDRLVKGVKPGVNRQLPHLTSNGMGVNHAGTREPGTEYHPVTMPELTRWFRWLSARIRHVRIIHGDWTRAVTTGASKTLNVRAGDGPCGVFLDPPYAETAGRASNLYAVDSLDVAHDVCRWAIEHGDDTDSTGVGAQRRHPGRDRPCASARYPGVRIAGVAGKGDARVTHEVPHELLTVLAVCGSAVSAVRGWANIGKAVGCPVSTAGRLARRARDPLPVRKHLGSVYVRTDDLVEWLERNTGVLLAAETDDSAETARADETVTCRTGGG